MVIFVHDEELRQRSDTALLLIHVRDFTSGSFSLHRRLYLQVIVKVQRIDNLKPNSTNTKYFRMLPVLLTGLPRRYVKPRSYESRLSVATSGARMRIPERA